MLKLFLGSVALALAGGSSVPELPTQLPSSLGGFAFGDSIAQLRSKCHAVAGEHGYFRESYGIHAVCQNVRPGKPYLPPRTYLEFLLKDGGVTVIQTEVPMPILMEYARKIAQDPKHVEPKPRMFCSRFPDGIDSMCADLGMKTFALVL